MHICFAHSFNLGNTIRKIMLKYNSIHLNAFEKISLCARKNVQNQVYITFVKPFYFIQMTVKTIDFVGC